MRALGLAKGGALRVGGLGESEADYLDAPGAGPALGARPKPRKGGKTSAASKRARASPRHRLARPAVCAASTSRASPARRPCARCRTPSRLRTRPNTNVGASRFPTPLLSPARRSPRRSRCVRSASPCTRSGTCTAARSRAGTGPAPAACSTTRARRHVATRETARAVADDRRDGRGGPRVPGHERPNRPHVRRAVAHQAVDRGVREHQDANAHQRAAVLRVLRSVNYARARRVVHRTRARGVRVGQPRRARVGDAGIRPGDARARAARARRRAGRTRGARAGANHEAEARRRADETAAEPRRLASLAELARCAAGGGGARVRAFLETDELVSESARRWPAWRARVVPRIVASLLAIAGKDATVPFADAPGRERASRGASRQKDETFGGLLITRGDDASFAKRDEASNPARKTLGNENVPPAGVAR